VPKVSLFLFLRTVPSSLFSSPLLDAELMLLGPVGFLAGTAKEPDKTLAADLGEPLLVSTSIVRIVIVEINMLVAQRAWFLELARSNLRWPLGCNWLFWWALWSLVRRRLV